MSQLVPDESLRWLFACYSPGMRPFQQMDQATWGTNTPAWGRLSALPLLALLSASACTLGCAGVGAGSVAPSPPPPTSPSISVTLTPASATVLLGNKQTFVATVTNASNTGVTWSVNGVPGGTSATGTITADGVYTAPADLSTSAGTSAGGASGTGTSSTAVQVTATSVADGTKSATSSVTIASDIVLGLSPTAAAVELGATRSFQPMISSGGHPDSAVRWSVSGTACPSACGAVDANGNFAAPQILPIPATVTLTAQSVADPSKTASATVTITSSFTVQLSGPTSVLEGGSVMIVATLTPVLGSNPATALAWSLSGTGCSGAACGALTVVTTRSATGSASADSATYTAPVTQPIPNIVAVTVTPQADPSKKAQITLSIEPGVGGVIVSPATATVAGNHRVTLTGRVNGSPSTGVTWSVNGVAGGSAALGQICVVATNPCQPVTSGSAAQVDYLAPGSIPNPNPVTVQATSAADPSKSAGAQITVINHVIVTVQPANATLAPLAVQAFRATVIGTSNQSVTWQIRGTPCTAGAVCGAIDQTGIYAAPDTAPSSMLQIVAVSADDTSQVGIANLVISTGANIFALHPASVYAGAANGFTLRVDGSGFSVPGAGAGSVLLIGGVARTTTCSTMTECTAPVTATDVAIPAYVSVQMQNPNGAKSNVVSLVVAAPNTSDDVFSLTAAAPTATGKDIVVVEPTTAGVSVPGNDVDLNVAALGIFSVPNNSCTLGGNPLALQRPASGTVTADICLFSESGLDTGMSYTVSGPGDIAVISKQPLGLGIVRITLEIPAAAAPGARSLFIQNTNLDKTAASGALEVN